MTGVSRFCSFIGAETEPFSYGTLFAEDLKMGIKMKIAAFNMETCCCAAAFSILWNCRFLQGEGQEKGFIFPGCPYEVVCRKLRVSEKAAGMHRDADSDRNGFRKKMS